MKNDHFYQPPEAMKMLMPTCWADLASGVLVHHWYISGEGGSRRQCEGPCAPISFSLPAPRWRTKINFALSYIFFFLYIIIVISSIIIIYMFIIIVFYDYLLFDPCCFCENQWTPFILRYFLVWSVCP